jgi:hypothetical protein
MSGNDLNFLPQQERTANYSQSSILSFSHSIKIAADSNSTTSIFPLRPGCKEATDLKRTIAKIHSCPTLTTQPALLILKLIDIGGFQWSKSEGKKKLCKKNCQIFLYLVFILCSQKYIKR